MSLKIAAVVAGLALAGFAVSGCVETGPGYGGGYHRHDRTAVYVQPHHRTKHRDYGHKRPSHHTSGHHHSMKPKVDCRRHPRDRACRGHH